MCAKKAVAAPAIQTGNAKVNMVLRHVSFILADRENGVVVRELYGWGISIVENTV